MVGLKTIIPGPPDGWLVEHITLKYFRRYQRVNYSGSLFVYRGVTVCHSRLIIFRDNSIKANESAGLGLALFCLDEDLQHASNCSYITKQCSKTIVQAPTWQSLRGFGWFWYMLNNICHIVSVDEIDNWPRYRVHVLQQNVWRVHRSRSTFDFPGEP